MNHKSSPVTIAVTGAAGNIGYAILFRLAAGELLGPDVQVRLNLLDIPDAAQALEGVAMELADCAFPLLESVNTFSDPVRAFDGVNCAFLIGARPRTAGMERADLLSANGEIFAPQGRALADGAADDLRVVVVGNPANTNALIAAHHGRGIPRERFTALTRLDHNRALAQLAQATETGVGEIEGVAIWGNHSASQYPSLEFATVAGVPALEVLKARGKDHSWVEDEFIPRVAQRGAEIIRVRGGSSVGSAAHAAIEHMRDWMSDEPVETSMAVPSTGAYGVEEGLVCSFPVICEGGEYRIREGLELGEFSKARLRASVEELKAERDTVLSLGLLA
ncbi:malate dehydrogenase [Rothia aerolata]|uniref:Malate dehydrogenase n=1 Tax=Rothia aerolata TaxID=1812262 RepID=A0A917MPT4_9MICC|nr:malate dehydrogenase [Rothia aerolata]GGH56671.1 malate dehydrogenase [Rothia aerolata]